MFPDDDQPGIVLAFPGPWADKAACRAAIAKTHLGVAAGLIILDMGSQSSAGFWIEPRADTLSRDMSAGSGRAFDDAALNQIGNHTLLPHICIDPGEAGFAAKSRAFSEIMKAAGAYGVYISRTGIAHPFERWDDLLAAGDPASLYYALIVHVKTDHETLSSFGMKQFGLPDAMVPADPSGEGGDAHTLQAFNLYHWIEGPAFEDGETFSAAADAPRFELTLFEDERYPPGHHHLNPHGVWQLGWA